MSDSENDGVRVKLEWHIPDNFPTPNATNVIAQSTQHEFVLSFFEILPPLLTGTPEEQAAQAKQLEIIRAECVARVIISAGRMPEFLQVLQEHYAQYLSRFEKNGKNNG